MVRRAQAGGTGADDDNGRSAGGRIQISRWHAEALNPFNCLGRNGHCLRDCGGQ
jgi:hypothetical protein